MNPIKKSKKGKAPKDAETILDDFPPVPDGKLAKIRYFGACTTGSEIMVILEWGDAVGGFAVCHAISIYGNADPGKLDDQPGDGIKHFRVSAINELAKDSEAIYWFDYLET